MAAEGEWASHTKQKISAKPGKQYTRSTQVKSIPLNFDGGLSFSSKARNLAKQNGARSLHNFREEGKEGKGSLLGALNSLKIG